MIRTKHLRKLFLLLVFLFVSAGIVSALTLSSIMPTWSGIVGTSGQPTCLNQYTDPITGEILIRFGDTDITAGCTGTSESQSGIGFQANSSATFESGVPFVLGQLTHYNNPIYPSDPYSLLQSVTLNLETTFGTPAYTDDFSTSLALDETANNLSTCPYGGDNGCADRLSVERKSFPILVNGTEYQFEILGLIPGNLPACAYDETLISTHFVSEETASNSACLFGSLTTLEEARLEITKDTIEVDAEPGQLIDYKIDYNCFSTTESCNGVVLTDTLPEEVEYVGSTGSIHTTSTSGVYSSGNHSVRFNFINPMPAGSTGYVTVRVRVRSDGTVANNEAITNTAISTLTNGITTTVYETIPFVGASNWNVTKTGPTNVYLDTDRPVTDATYTVSICSAGSTVNLENAQMVDTLPLNAVFVSATGNPTQGTTTTELGTQETLTWDLGTLLASSNCTSRQVTVRYPEYVEGTGTETEPPVTLFSTGDTVTNRVDASGDPVGETPWTDNATVTNQLSRLTPDPRATIVKGYDRQDYVVGAVALFTLSPEVTGNVPLENLTITDTLPPQLDLVSITAGQYVGYSGTVQLQYQTNNSTEWVNWRFAEPATNQSYPVSELGLPEGTYITAVRWVFPLAQPGFRPTTNGAARVYARLISPDRNGVVLVTGATITNNATISWHYSGGEGSYGSASGSASLQVAEMPNPLFTKASVGGVSADWRFLIGQEVGYYTLNPNNNTGIPLDNFVITDEIPAPFNVTSVTVGSYGNFTGGTVQLRYQTDNSGVWVNWGSAVTPSNQTLEASGLNLGGARITDVQWVYGTVPAGFYASTLPRINGTVSGQDNDAIQNNARLDWTYTGVPGTRTSSTNNVIRLPVAEAAPSKTTTTTGPYIPSSIVGYSLRVMAANNSPSALIDPIVIDVLPLHMSYVPNSADYNAGNSDIPAPTLETATTSDGRTLLRWRFDGDFQRGQSAIITFQAAIGPGAPNADLTNNYYITSAVLPIINGTPDTLDLDADGATNDYLNVSNNTSVTVDELVGLNSSKGVRGELDASFIYPLGRGQTIPNGSVTYQLNVINQGNIPIENVRVIDILPDVNDTGVQDLRPRGSQWRPVLTGLVDAPANVTVYYSASGNPCRPEIVSSGPAGCSPANWSTLPPADIASVRSVRFNFSSILDPGETFSFSWTMQAPADAAEDTVAWNSFAFTSTNAETHYPLRPSEPNKVGVTMVIPEYAPLIQLEKSTNGYDADFAPGPLIAEGQPVEWTYRITNTGNTRLSSFTLSDDKLGVIPCTIPTLDAGQSHLCTMSGTAGDIPYSNIGTVMATPLDVYGNPLLDSNNQPRQVTDTDPSHYYGYDPYLARLGDHVWIDTDGNGIQDEGEPGLPGITVRLLDGSGNPVLDDDDLNPITTTTDGNGNYAFTNLLAGSYSVQFVLPPVYAFTPQNAGADDTIDSDANPVDGKSDVITLEIDPLGEQNFTLDAGVVGRASLGNFVWMDSNDDGIQDEGELPAGGISVRLYSTSNTTTPVATTITDEDGIYRFLDLAADSYYLVFTAPNGYVFSKPNVGTDDAVDSDPDRVSGQTGTITLSAGVNDTSWDAGLVRVASIGNFVWADMDNDGVQDSGETGVSGVTVTLYDSTDQQIGSPKTTSATGSYSFTDLIPGDYYLVFDPPQHYIHSPQDAGSDDTKDSDADGSGRTATTTLSPNENDTSWDAGLVPLATIGDLVWLDLDNDGVQDGNEDGFENITVNLLDSGGSLLQTDQTDASGLYGFSDLTPGQYIIEVVSPSDHVFSPRNAGADDADSDVDRSTGRTGTITLAPGNNQLQWDAGLVADAEIGNYVWYDEDNDGIQDESEAVTVGVTVRLLDSGANVVDTRITDGNGKYMFTHLTPAQYSLEFVMPVGYAPAYRDQGEDDALDSDPDRFTHRTSLTTLGPNEPDMSWDMGLVQVASIGDFVWHDANGDSVQGDPEIEQGVSGVTVRLYDSGNVLRGTTTSSASEPIGSYSFTNLPPEIYYLVFTLPNGYVFSLQDSVTATDETDSDVNIGSGRTATTTLSPNENDTSWDAGLISVASIGDKVWRDSNNNGVQDAEEDEGISNVTVSLYLEGGSFVSSTSTAADGSYSFTNLRNGQYYLNFSMPAVNPSSYVRSPQDVGEATDATDSDASVTTGNTEVTTLDPGENDDTWDAGLTPLSSIGNWVWRDNNNNGIQDDGEPGISGVTVILYTSSDVFVDETTTDASGNYAFTNLDQGSYYLVFDLPAHYIRSMKDAAAANDTTDSDTNPTTGQTDIFTLPWDTNTVDWDMGIVPLATIGDRVWEDLNDNGIQDDAAQSVSGVTVTLYDSADQPVGVPVVTGSDGSYSFSDLVPGDYYLRFELPNSNYVFARHDVSSNSLDATDSDVPRVLAQLTGETATTTLIPGENDTSWDAGILRLASIGDFVWNDTNDNGRWDTMPLPAESGFSDVQIELFYSNGDSTGLTTLTDEDGFYSFTNLVPDNYYLRFTLPTNYVFSRQDVSSNGYDTSDSDVNRSTGRTIATHLLSGDNQTQWDAGLMQVASIGDRVWNDVNDNGIQDDGESGLNNVPVSLYNTDSTTTFITSTTTASDGSYSFTGVTPGRYLLEFGTYSGYTLSKPNQTTPSTSDVDDEVDSDPSRNNRRTANTTLTPGENDMTWDAGYMQVASIGNRVWVDSNDNGIQDDGESGHNGVQVRLYSSSNPTTPVATTTTSGINENTGSYNFANVVPGDYYVRFTLPAGFVFSQQDQGGDDAKDSDVVRVAGQTTGDTATTDLDPGENDLTWDAGIMQVASIGNRVWDDRDNDGVQDAGEPGHNGVTVNLYSSSNPTTPVATTTTSGSGSSAGGYSFTGLVPGQYYLDFVLPGGHVFSRQNVGADEDADSDADRDSGETVVTDLDPGENDLTWDAGIMQVASIGSYVWEDLNDNGIQDDGGESGYDGLLVTLYDGEGNPLDTDTTDASGNYSFTNLVPGDYAVGFTLPNTSYVFSRQDVNDNGSDTTDSDADPTGMAVETTLLPGENDTSWDAGILQLGSIGDFVWHDENDNGVQDDEDGIGGVLVTLTGENGFSDTDTTDPDGSYGFTNLVPGNYTLHFDLPDSTFVYSRQNEGADDAVDSDVDRSTGNVSIHLLSGIGDNTLDAGMMERASIGDRVWNDANDNGIQDEGELGYEGLTVTLTGENNVSLMDETDENGLYSFTSLIPGNYELEFDLPTGYVFSRRDQTSADPLDTDDAVDSDPDRATGQTVTTHLLSGEDDLSWDAGIMEVVSIGNFVWDDLNNNGIQDENEPGVQNVTIEFYDSSDNLIDTTTTDAEGEYTFVSLIPGDYYLVFTLPTNYVFSRPNAGGDNAIDSDVNRILGQPTGRTATTNLHPGENDTSWDAGIMRTASIGDRVWLDTNDNGLQDPGEDGIFNVTVTLTSEFDEPTSIVTDASGNYSFGGLVPGNYSLHFALPGDDVFSRLDVSGNTLDTTDSDADRSSGETPTTHLLSGENDSTWDAGVMRRAAIGNRVWNDSNDNGVQDEGEDGIEGVTVTLTGESGLAGTTTTDEDGLYTFAELVPGNYSLHFDLPEGFVFSRQNQGDNDAEDSDADRSSGQTQTTHLTSDMSDLTWDAGLMRVSSIGDTVWSDTDADGIQDEGEPPLPGVTVTLHSNESSFVESTTTDADGNYVFEGLVPGEYYLVFTPPPSYLFSPLDAGESDAIDSDADTSSGQTIVTDLDPSEIDLTWDAGMFQYASLGSLVWDDLNADGIQDAGEPGIEGAPVTLYDSADTLVATATTDSSGAYSFTDLIPGDYYAVFTLPAGFIFSPIDVSEDDALDSDANITTGRADTTTLISGENDPTWDAGMYRTTALGNVVWDDLDADGVQDQGEPGVEGVTVDLYDGTETLLDSTTTDADGGYLFTELVPGNYHVVFTLPADYLFSPRSAAQDSSADSDADTTTGATAVTTLISNEVDLTWDAGIYRLATVGDLVWLDLDADGLQGLNEAGLPDIIVTLYDETNTMLATTTTNADGLYSFSNLEPGDYAVGFTLPIGYAFTQQVPGADATLDSNADLLTGRTLPINLISGEDDDTWDAGLALLSSIGDRVWEDLNYNGVQDAGERGIAGVAVALYSADGTLVASTTTDGDGLYEFIHLEADDYAVQFTLLNGYTFSPRDAGADETDSDVDGDSGRTSFAALDWGEDNASWDAGMVQLGTLGDRLWLDSNRDGIQDAAESGIAGVTVTLDGLQDGQQTTVTDANGFYGFEELPPGNYTVTLSQDTLPRGLEATYDPDGNPDAVATIALTAGEEMDTVDFGYARPPVNASEVPVTACPRQCVDWVLYHTDRTGDWEIFRLGGGDGTLDINLTRGENSEDIAPSRSPNADWIVFASNRDGNWELYLASTDGTGEIRRLTHNTIARDTNPVWGPNNYVVFETTRNGNWDLYLMDMASGALRQLTDDLGSDVNASWSPNGTKIAFQSDRSGQWQIYELDLRTMETTLLSDGLGADLDPQYNNAGDRIAFRSYRNGSLGVIYTMNADGSNVQAITDVNGDAANHIWSPDDSMIAFQASFDGDLDVYVYEFGTQQTRQVTDNDIPDYAPMWRCDTNTLLFTSDVSGNPDIYDTEALPINAPAIVVEREADQLTFDLSQDIYPLDAPAEEIASREGLLPNVDEAPAGQTQFLTPDVTTSEIDVSVETSRFQEIANICPLSSTLFHETDGEG